MLKSNQIGNTFVYHCCCVPLFCNGLIYVFIYLYIKVLFSQQGSGQQSLVPNK